MTYTIRPLTDSDYPAVAALASETYDRTITAEFLRTGAAGWDPRCRHGILVAEADTQVVGFGEYMQFPGSYHPRMFNLGLTVRPDCRGRGIGSALYSALLTTLRPYDPISLTSGVREDRPGSIAFAERRGFEERLRNWVSLLDLTAFDPAAYVGAVAAAAARGYEFLPYTALAGDPDRDRRIYELFSEVRLDIPSPTPRTEIAFAEWAKRLSSPYFFPEAFWLARKADRLVGLSIISTTDDEGLLDTGVTGVRREHRGAGVAKALKVKALAAAKEQGYQRVKTVNAKENVAMLAVNQWLGFERKPGWISFVLQLQSGE